MEEEVWVKVLGFDLDCVELGVQGRRVSGVAWTGVSGTCHDGIG